MRDALIITSIVTRKIWRCESLSLLFVSPDERRQNGFTVYDRTEIAMDKINVQTKLRNDSCTGCGLCTVTCPTGAIKLVLDKMLSTVRAVDDNKCISCNKCVRLCPQITYSELNTPVACYASFPILEQRKTIYSSGGAASLIAMKFMQTHKGVVCGCTWDRENRRAKHVIITQIDQLERLCGSKYVQSDMSGIYEDIKRYIDCKICVLFIGTPCQADAILKYCNSEYLYTVDLICHGTPPASYLSAYVKTLPRYNEISEIRFRGEHDFWFTAKNDRNDEIYCAYKDCDPYFYAFLKGTIYRENCYKCKYAQLNRVADITLGDFWGIERNNLEYSGKISLILINTIKGEKVVNESGDMMIIEERKLEEAIRGNLQLSAPMKRTAEHLAFTKMLEVDGDFIHALKRNTIYKEAMRNKRNMSFAMRKHRLKKFLKNIGLIRGNS